MSGDEYSEVNWVALMENLRQSVRGVDELRSEVKALHARVTEQLEVMEENWAELEKAVSFALKARSRRGAVTTGSRIEDEVIRKIAERQEAGSKKYGTTMERTDLDTKEWLQHAQEEALDLAVYLQKLISGI